jgi:hypothetical protein
MAGSGTASEPAADVVARDDAAAATRGADAAATATNASAISFGFAATAVLVSMHYSKRRHVRRPSYLRRPCTRPSEISLCPTAATGSRK